MIRNITFTAEGHIHIEGEMSSETIRCGVVLLTKAQAAEAKKHGWLPYGPGPYATSTTPALYAVKKKSKAGIVPVATPKE